MQLPQARTKASSTTDSTTAATMPTTVIFQLAFRSLTALSKYPSPLLMYLLIYYETGRQMLTIRRVW